MAPLLPQGWHSLTTRIVTHEPERLVLFLKDAFGATGEFRSEAPAQMHIGDSIVMVSGAQAREPAAAFLHLYVDDADAVYRQALAAGAVSLEEPSDVPYGDRRAMVKDPCGNDWQIATYGGAAPKPT